MTQQTYGIHGFEPIAETGRCNLCGEGPDGILHLRSGYGVAAVQPSTEPWKMALGSIQPVEDNGHAGYDEKEAWEQYQTKKAIMDAYQAESEAGKEYNAVEPPHYQRGPVIKGHIGSAITQGKGAWEYTVKCIDVMRAIPDPRLATAFKYIWRVAFGGKCEPGMEASSQRDRDTRDIKSAIWYLQDWVANPVQLAEGPSSAYDVAPERH